MIAKNKREILGSQSPSPCSPSEWKIRRTENTSDGIFKTNISIFRLASTSLCSEESLSCFR